VVHGGKVRCEAHVFKSKVAGNRSPACSCVADVHIDEEHGLDVLLETLGEVSSVSIDTHDPAYQRNTEKRAEPYRA
jgi:hypothetical protein